MGYERVQCAQIPELTLCVIRHFHLKLGTYTIIGCEYTVPDAALVTMSAQFYAQSEAEWDPPNQLYVC